MKAARKKKQEALDYRSPQLAETKKHVSKILSHNEADDLLTLARFPEILPVVTKQAETKSISMGESNY